MRFVLLFVGLVLAPFAVSAQNCVIVPESIVKLRAPEIGAFNIWDAVYGELGTEENFKAGFVKENGHSVAVGERYSIGDESVSLLLVEYDRRGRMVWEKVHEVPELQDIIKVFEHEDGFVVLANKHDGPRIDAAWIGVFDAMGVLKYKRLIRLPNLRIAARDLVQSPLGDGFVMAASSKAKTANAALNSVFITLNSKFQFVSKRSYQPGPENEILGLTLRENAVGRQLIATGYIRNARGRKNAWVLALEGDGAIAWQHQFPRGAGALLKEAVPYGERYVVAVGEAMPAGKDVARGGWVAMIKGDDGDILWQRYYTGQKYAYTVRDVLVSEDGLISILLDGEPPAFRKGKAMKKVDDQEKDQEDYVRLLMLDPRGGIINSIPFFHGQSADAYQILRGAVRERILLGGSDMRYEIENAEMPEAPDIIETREGWAVVAPAMDRYQDPCQ